MNQTILIYTSKSRGETRNSISLALLHLLPPCRYRLAEHGRFEMKVHAPSASSYYRHQSVGWCVIDGRLSWCALGRHVCTAAGSPVHAALGTVRKASPSYTSCQFLSDATSTTATTRTETLITARACRGLSGLSTVEPPLVTALSRGIEQASLRQTQWQRGTVSHLSTETPYDDTIATREGFQA